MPRLPFPAFLLLLVAASCGGDAPPAADPLPLDDPAFPFDEQAFPVAEHRYRGIVAMGPDSRGFTPCGEPVPAWVEDATGGELLDLYATLASIPNEPLYAELVGSMGEPPRQGPGARYPYGFTVTAVRQLSYAPEAPDCPDPEFGIVARGNEPSWHLSVGGETMELRTPEDPAPAVFAWAGEEWRGGARVLRGEAFDAPGLELEIREERCIDDMSGEVFPYRAVLVRGGRRLQGCAWGEG